MEETQSQARDRKRQQLHLQANTAAKEAQDADRSDVFTYNRIYSRIMNGVGQEYAKP